MENTFITTQPSDLTITNHLVSEELCKIGNISKAWEGVEALCKPVVTATESPDLKNPLLADTLCQEVVRMDDLIVQQMPCQEPLRLSDYLNKDAHCEDGGLRVRGADDCNRTTDFGITLPTARRVTSQTYSYAWPTATIPMMDALARRIDDVRKENDFLKEQVTSISATLGKLTQEKRVPDKQKLILKKRARVVKLGADYQNAIEEYNTELQRETTAEEPDSFARLFNSIDVNALARCFAELYRAFFGMDKKKILPYECTPIEFCVYLLVLCEKAGLGREGFLTNSVKPFIKFIQNKVILDMDTSDITFWKRVNKMRFAIKKMQQGDHYTGRVLKKDELGHCENYSVVEKTYFESEFYQGLRRLVL